MTLGCIRGGPASTTGGISMRSKIARYLTWTLMNAYLLLTTLSVRSKLAVAVIRIRALPDITAPMIVSGS